MRCSQCDANDQGLSDYRLDGRRPHSYHVMPNGDILCDECVSWDDELQSDYALDDEVNENE